MVLLRIVKLCLILSTQSILIQCQTSQDFNKISSIQTDIHPANKPVQDFDSFPNPSKQHDFIDLQENIQNSLNQMRENLNSEFKNGLDGIPGFEFIKRLPLIIPLPEDDQQKIKIKQEIISEKQNATAAARPKIESEVPENNDPTVVFLKSFGTLLDSNLKPEENRNDIDHPLDIGKIFQAFDELTEPRDRFVMPSIFGDERHFIGHLEDEEREPEDVAQLSFITLDNNDESFPRLPFQQGIHISFPVDDIVGSFAGDQSNAESLGHKGFMDDFVQTIRRVMNMLQQKATTNRPSYDDVKSEDGKKLDIKIEDHGYIYNIPSNAFLDHSNPQLVNITWNSGLKAVNNSLSLNISKDDAGHEVFKHVHLRILKDNKIQEYKLDGPTYLEDENGDRTVLKMGGGVSVNFPKPSSMEVSIVKKKEGFPKDWLAMAVAVLGLIVAGFIMLLSYAMYMRNKLYSRKNSFSKEPIA